MISFGYRTILKYGGAVLRFATSKPGSLEYNHWVIEGHTTETIGPSFELVRAEVAESSHPQSEDLLRVTIFK